MQIGRVLDLTSKVAFDRLVSLQGFKNLMEHTKWPKRDERIQEGPASPGALSPTSASASSAPRMASPPSIPSVFANNDRPFPVRERPKPSSRKQGTQEAKESTQEAANKPQRVSEEEDRQGGLTKPVGSAGGTLRWGYFQRLRQLLGVNTSA